MGRISGNLRDDGTLEGRSDFDGKDAKLHEAFDALAMVRVLLQIGESDTASDEAKDLAAQALERLAAGDPEAGPLARSAAETAVSDNGGDPSPYELEIHDVSIDIVTRPHNQWVRTFKTKSSAG
jgi:hypothetical protein